MSCAGLRSSTQGPGGPKLAWSGRERKVRCMTQLREYRAWRSLMVHLTLRELRAKYKRSVLGWAWSLLNPLAVMLIYTLVFRLFLRIEPPVGSPSGLQNFALFLLCGLLPWNLLQSATTSAVTVLIDNANLVKKTFFPRELLVASQVLSWLVSFLIEMLLLSVVFLVVGNMVLPYLLVVAAIIAMFTLFVMGLALTFSVLNVYFRDVKHLVGILFQAWFYLSPILYPVSLVPERVELLGTDLPARSLYHLNPVVGFVEAFRDCFYHVRLPTPAELSSLLAVSLVTVLAGLTVFNRLEPNLAEEL